MIIACRSIWSVRVRSPRDREGNLIKCDREVRGKKKHFTVRQVFYAILSVDGDLERSTRRWVDGYHPCVFHRKLTFCIIDHDVVGTPRTFFTATRLNPSTPHVYST